MSKLYHKLDCLKKEISGNKITYLLLLIILSFSVFFRLYRLDKLLGFWYDQGRDALVIWDLLYYKKFFLIGPVTGIEGIFLGPFYYYLLAPFYWLGRGSPVFVAAYLSWLTGGAVFLLYYLGAKIYGRKVGLIAAFLYGFSYNMVIFSRWLANPNPLPFFSLLALIFIWLSISKKASYFIFVGLIVGLCLQLEAASAIFFLPAVVIIIFWQRKKLLNFKVLLPFFLLFLITLLPQIIFNFRHQGILLAAFRKFLLAEKSFRLSLWEVSQKRLMMYYDSFFGKLFPSFKNLRLISLAIFLITAIVYRKKAFSTSGKILAIWLVAPLAGFLFYQGNHGYVWDYYFTGVYPVFYLIFSAGVFWLFKQNFLNKLLIFSFLSFFLFNNLVSLKNYYRAGIGISLQAQLRAIDWIYQDAGEKDFNVDVYVPPQIFYSYSYLFRWYGGKEYGRAPEEKLVSKLYTLYEPDGEHPQFLKAWLKRQDGIGKILKSYSWGGITIDERVRIN